MSKLIFLQTVIGILFYINVGAQALQIQFNYEEIIANAQHERLRPSGLVWPVENPILAPDTERYITLMQEGFAVFFQIKNESTHSITLEIITDKQNYQTPISPGLHSIGPFYERDFTLIAQNPLLLQNLLLKKRKEVSQNFNNSGSCNVNVQCPEGQNWQQQKNATVMLSIPIGGFLFDCSGVMVNNTAQDLKPYLLTAEHCFMFQNALENPTVLNQTVVSFGYEAPACGNPADSAQITSYNHTGLDFVARSDDDGGDVGSDFALLLLKGQTPAQAPIYLAGWDRRDLAAASGVGLHHPNGDLKKVSTYTAPLKSAPSLLNIPDTHWEVSWAATTSGHGITEQGSSGSPIFNFGGLVVGTLTAGSSACNNLTGTDIYGKIYHQWDKNGSAANRQLKPHLDPLNTGVQQLAGTLLSTETWATPYAPALLYPNPSQGSIQIQTPENVYDKLVIYHLSGQKLYEQNLDPRSPLHTMDVTLKPGMYLLTLSGKHTQTLRLYRQ